MSSKELSTLRAEVEAKPGVESTIAAGTGESQMPHIPEELSILPVRGLVIFPERSFHLMSTAQCRLNCSMTPCREQK